MVKNYGMSDKVGVRLYDARKNNDYAPSTTETIDNEVKRLLQVSTKQNLFVSSIANGRNIYII